MSQFHQAEMHALSIRTLADLLMSVRSRPIITPSRWAGIIAPSNRDYLRCGQQPAGRANSPSIATINQFKPKERSKLFGRWVYRRLPNPGRTRQPNGEMRPLSVQCPRAEFSGPAWSIARETLPARRSNAMIGNIYQKPKRNDETSDHAEKAGQDDRD